MIRKRRQAPQPLSLCEQTWLFFKDGIPFALGGLLWLMITYLTASFSPQGRILLRLGAVAVLALIAGLSYRQKKTGYVYAFGGAALLLDLFMAGELGQFAYVDGGRGLRFWPVSAAFAATVLLGGVLLLLLRRRRIPSPGRLSLSIVSLLCVGFLLFLQTELSLTLLNVALDRSEPATVTATVDGKWTEMVGRRSQYHFLLADNGDAHLKFAVSAYDDYTPGDSVTLWKHRGALGAAYYSLEQ